MCSKMVCAMLRPNLLVYSTFNCPRHVSLSHSGGCNVPAGDEPLRRHLLCFPALRLGRGGGGGVPLREAVLTPEFSATGHAVAVAADLDDVAVMQEPVDQRGRHASSPKISPHSS